MRMRKLIYGIGAGLIAGLAGTAAMTLSSKAEARLLKRHAPSPTATVAKNVLGIEKFATPMAEARFADLVHWGYGAGWGALHGVLRSVGLPPKAATAAHYAGVWGGSLVLLPSHDVVPPIFLRGRAEVVAEAWHQLVYATATGFAYELLDGRS